MSLSHTHPLVYVGWTAGDSKSVVLHHVNQMKCDHAFCRRKCQGFSLFCSGIQAEHTVPPASLQTSHSFDKACHIYQLRMSNGFAAL